MLDKGWAIFTVFPDILQMKAIGPKKDSSGLCILLGQCKLGFWTISSANATARKDRTHLD